MNVKLVKVVSSKKYVDKNGKEKAYENFALEVGGYRIFIKPSFKQSYYLLSILAEPTTISDGDKKK